MGHLEPGETIRGPVLIEAETTTVILHRGDMATITDAGWLDIEVTQRASVH
ncbi:hypothetical protein AB4144_51120 [Rhizobiaceae sp. 2RAB30]